MSHLGFDWQRGGTCSRFALRHALLCLGLPTTERGLSQSMGRSRLRTALLGSEESAILRGIREHGATPRIMWHEDPGAMQQGLERLLAKDAPCIVCVKDQYGTGWAHWAVIAGHAGNQFFWIDSDDGNLIGSWSAKQILEWMKCDGEERPYYAIGLRPKRALHRSRSIVGHFAEVATLLDHGNLHLTWGTRLAELTTVFTVAQGGISARKFFAQHGRAIVKAAVGQRGASAETVANHSLEAYRAVAHSHRLRLADRRTDIAQRKLEHLVGLELRRKRA